MWVLCLLLSAKAAGNSDSCSDDIRTAIRLCQSGLPSPSGLFGHSHRMEVQPDWAGQRSTLEPKEENH